MGLACTWVTARMSAAMCDDDAEEVCYDEWSLPSHCAKIVDGGCHPCFDGQVKCGARPGFSGICVDVCCDKSESEDCYKDDGEKYCAKFTDGGCPCGDGYVRCHYEKRRIEPFPGLGYCEPASWCCKEDEELCDYYDSRTRLSTRYCAPKTAKGGCPKIVESE